MRQEKVSNLSVIFKFSNKYYKREVKNNGR